MANGGLSETFERINISQKQQMGNAPAVEFSTIVSTDKSELNLQSEFHLYTVKKKKKK